jgi:hypothetical protein
MQDVHHGIRGNVRIFRQELIHPVGMFLQQRILTDIRSVQDCFRQLLQFRKAVLFAFPHPLTPALLYQP